MATSRTQTTARTARRGYTLEVLRNKSYRKMFVGRESQCFKRLPSMTHRARIKNAAGEIIYPRAA